MNTTTLPTTLPTTAQAAAESWQRLKAAGAALLSDALGQAPAETDTVYLRRIDRGGTHWISRPQGRRVVCDSGVLWLCFDGDNTDVLLEPGASHTCTLKARLSVYALQAGSFHVV